jgi:hypothetical protein
MMIRVMTISKMPGNKDIQQNIIQNNDVQNNNIQHIETLHKDNQHDYTQHNHAEMQSFSLFNATHAECQYGESHGAISMMDKINNSKKVLKVASQYVQTF